MSPVRCQRSSNFVRCKSLNRSRRDWMRPHDWFAPAICQTDKSCWSPIWPNRLGIEATSEASLSIVFGEDPAVALTIFDLGDFDGVNRSLSIPRLADLTPPRGVPVAVSTTLQLSAKEETSTLSVTAELEIYENDPGLPVVRDGVIQRPQAAQRRSNKRSRGSRRIERSVADDSGDGNRYAPRANSFGWR